MVSPTHHSPPPNHPYHFPPGHPPLHRSESMPQHLNGRPAGLTRTYTTPSVSPEVATTTPSGPAAAAAAAAAGSSSRRRTAQSSNRSDEDAEPGPEELTTKGRKRKRLAKACSACHKNKRRCDGFAPCSNCEFSSRPCLYINSAGEVIPPPRTREVPKKEPGPSSTSPDKGQSADGSRRTKHTPSPKRDRLFIDPLDAVERDVSLSAELIDIFFNRVHPYGAMIHPPSFHHRLFLGVTSPILLDTIYALSAHLSLHPAILEAYPPATPQWARGEPFAERAHQMVKRVMDMRASWSEEEALRDRGTWEETEFVQALTLLGVYYSTLRQPQIGQHLLDIALDIFQPLPSGALPPPSSMLGGSSAEFNTVAECRNRTYWMIALQDLQESAQGRPRRLHDHALYSLLLPSDELHWERYGGGVRQGREPNHREGLAIVGNWPREPGAVSELGDLLRILAVFSDIMSVANNSPGQEPRGTPVQHEQALKAWAHSLPRHLRFDETTLAGAVARLNSPLQAVSRSAWCFAMMHAIAECCTFFLQVTLSSGASSWTAQRQAQAIENIAVLLDAIGVRGRESPLLLCPLIVLTNWYEHLRSSGAPGAMVLEDRLAMWTGEAARDWCFDRVPMERAGVPPALAPPASSLGLYGPSSPVRGPDSAASTISAITLPTPGGRYSHTALPPLRPRSNTTSSLIPPVTRIQSPSPPEGHKPLPSVNSLSDPRKDIKLPPLPPMDPSPGPGGSFKFPSFWGESKERLTPSPRFEPYAKEKSSRTPPMKEVRAAISPLFKVLRDGDRSEKASVGEPVGIAALISAAEEKSREREAVDVKCN